MFTVDRSQLKAIFVLALDFCKHLFFNGIVSTLIGATIFNTRL